MLLFPRGHRRRGTCLTLAGGALLACLAFVPSRSLIAEDALSKPASLRGGLEVVLGQSLPITGPSGQLGRDYRRGAISWFEHLNRQGGIHGRRIRLVSLDDQYEPDQTLRNTKELLERRNLLALFGYVGTPTTKVALPLIESEKVPLIAPMTGASLLRRPGLRMVFNLRASYRKEIAVIVDGLVHDARRRIAVVYQNDAFGQDGLKGALAALKSHGLEPVVTATVERNSDQVSQAVDRLMKAQPNGVVIISAYVSSAALASDLRARGNRAQIMNVSFVGTKALQQAMPVGEANGIGVAQVVPFPWNRWIPVVAEYQRLMRLTHEDPSFGFTSLEGFLAARMMTEALQRAGADPTRERLVEALESIHSLDLGGFKLQMSRTDHQASDFVELTFLGSQSWEP